MVITVAKGDELAALALVTALSFAWKLTAFNRIESV